MRDNQNDYGGYVYKEYCQRITEWSIEVGEKKKSVKRLIKVGKERRNERG